MSGITLWKPEADVIIHQALGKACEEATELASILARCLIQGLDQSEPVTGKPNRQALFEEIADLDAAVQWLRAPNSPCHCIPAPSKDASDANS